MSATRTELAALIKRRGTADLATDLEALAVITALGQLDDAGRLVRGLIVETLYNRHLEIADAFNAWIDDCDSDEDETDVVIRAARDLIPTA